MSLNANRKCLVSAALLASLVACRPARPIGEDFNPAMVNTGTAASRSEFEAARVVTIDGRDITVGELERRLDSASSTGERYFSVPQRRPNFVQLLVYLELAAAEAARIGLVGTPVERVMSLDAAARSAMEAVATERLATADEISAAEVDAAYAASEQMFRRSAVRRAGVILLADRESAVATRAQLLEDLAVPDVVAGEVIAAVARRASLDAATREQGGDLGFFQMPADPAEADAVTRLVFDFIDIPSISEPVQTAAGWALYAVTSQIEPGAIDREQAGIWLRQHLESERRDATRFDVIAAAHRAIEPQVDQAVVDELRALRTAVGTEPSAQLRPRRYSAAGVSASAEQFYGESWRSLRSWYTADPARELRAAIVPLPTPSPVPLPVEGSGGTP
jgi:hypothetical protein